MTSENWQAAWRIYIAALELPADQQRAFVESESADPVLAREVFHLLASLEEEENEENSGADRTGTQVGRFQVGELLGRGGVGEVYAARDTDLDRPVALKFLRPESIGDPAAIRRFIREAKAASALNHPNIVTIHEVIDSTAGLAIAMEFVEGHALSSVRGVARPAERVIGIGQQIGRALAAAHQAGLIHRDIKPENILVRTDGYVKLVDFGLARHAGSKPAALETGELRPNDAVATGFSGTLRYMSPEQARGEEITSASDIFSFGLVLYEIAAGQHAFPDDSPLGTMEGILTRVPPPPSSQNAAIPPELDHLILRMLAKDPRTRPGAEEIAQTLADLERTPKASLGTGIGTWTAAAILILLAAGGLAVWHRQRTIRPVNLPEFRQVTTLVTENRATAAAISPDGKWTAYSNSEGFFLQPTDNNSPKPLQGPANFVTNRLVWSSDGKELLASGFSTAENTPEVWTISAIGDAPRLIRAHAHAAAFSPDGTRIAFISEDRSGIWTMAADGTAARRVLGGKEELFLLVFWSPDGKRLSYQRRRLWAETDIPDPETNTNHASRYESADANTGRILAQVPGMPITSAAQLSDGRIIFIRAANPTGEKWGYVNAGKAVWEVRTNLATGAFLEEPRRIADIEKKSTMEDLTAAADGQRILILKRTDQSAVFVADFDRSPPRFANVRRVILDEKKNYPHAWSNDNRSLIFESDRNGNSDLFRQYLDRRTPDPIVATSQIGATASGGWFGLEQLAPDGHTVLFAFRPDPKKLEEFRLMRVPLEGGTPQYVPIGGPQGETLDEFRCGVGGGRCVLRTAVAGKYFAFHELDPVRGKGRELARTAWSRNILGDWGLSADGTQVAIPNHFSRDASIRIVSLGEHPKEREVKVPGLSDLKGAVWAVDGSGWFVTSDTDIGIQMFFVFPNGRFHFLGDISGWAVPAPDGRHMAFMNRSTASNAWVLDR